MPGRQAGSQAGHGATHLWDGDGHGQLLPKLHAVAALQVMAVDASAAALLAVRGVHGHRDRQGGGGKVPCGG